MMLFVYPDEIPGGDHVPEAERPLEISTFKGSTSYEMVSEISFKPGVTSQIAWTIFEESKRLWIQQAPQWRAKGQEIIQFD